MSLVAILDRLAAPLLALGAGFGLLALGHDELGLLAIGGALGILVPTKASGLLLRK